MRFLIVVVVFAVPAAVVASILYWVIRLAVRHALEDADLRLRREARVRAADQWDPARTNH